MPRERLSDTSLAAQVVADQVLRDLGPEGRVGMMFELNEQVRKASRAGIRLRHPDYDDEQIRLAGIKLWLGPELFRKVFPGVEISA